MPIDVLQYLKNLDQERYRAVILHTSPEAGPAMTRFAQRVCAQSEGKYLDLLGFFIGHAELSAQIDRFGPEKFRALLLEQSQGVGLLWVDRADFVLDTWRHSERQDFFRMITHQWDGYKESMRAKLWVALQTSPEIEALSISDSRGQPRVLRLADFNDLL